MLQKIYQFLIKYIFSNESWVLVNTIDQNTWQYIVMCPLYINYDMHKVVFTFRAE